MAVFKGRGFSFNTDTQVCVMGILNVTPDSFSDGGVYIDPDIAVMRLHEMVNEGADVIDIGAMSTKPGHAQVTPQEEIERIAPVLRSLEVDACSVPISVDTYNVETAQYVLENGASIINDVSGVLNEEMAKLIAKHNAGWIITHTGGGDADNMVEYADVTADVAAFFRRALEFCEAYGISRSQLCFDVGFGFGKNANDNFKLLAQLEKTRCDEVPLMAALSRKRMIGEATGCEVSQRLHGTVAANAIAVMNGADVIRVHDIEPNIHACKVARKCL